ncbi:hypothetical protein NDO75_12115 [Natrinema sp. 1APR25-10V2]|nr:hypothetical protein [Natrinema sp. 1APR25-10V2]
MEHELREHLAGQPCAFCDDGRLTAGTYKGNTAMLCTNCGTPTVQLW